MSPRRISIALAAASLLSGLAACTTATTATDLSPAVMIGSVQGGGERSTVVGATVTVEGTVTGAFADGLGGWFLQDGGDGDPATSDALFVSAGTPVVRQGERVRVTGVVTEIEAGRGTLTALLPGEVLVLGRGARVTPLSVRGVPASWEPHEGMHLRIDAPLVLGGSHNLTRYGELDTSFGTRLFTPTELAAPGPAAARIASDNARRRLMLDDARSGEHLGPAAFLPAPGDVPRSGSRIDGAEGILDQRRGAYRLQLTAPLRVQATPRPPPPQIAGDLRLASFNLENLFNGDGHGGGFPTPRGARTPAALARQVAKLVATIRALDPDIAALMELENDGYGPRSSLAQLVDALNAPSSSAAAGGDWRFVAACPATGSRPTTSGTSIGACPDTAIGPGSDEIRVALVYRASRVAPVGPAALLEGGPFGTRSRVPLAQAFRAGAGPVFVVVANHFKSKGCSEASGADADQRDGQACWSALRSDSARRLDQWLRGDPTRSGGDLVAILGDFNAYAMEDPIRLLAAAGWIDALSAAGAVLPYSYVYDGQAGRLDHALLSPALAARLAGAAEWHSNADEPNVGDHDGNGPDPLANPWRSSDHDPLLLGLRLRAP